MSDDPAYIVDIRGLVAANYPDGQAASDAGPPQTSVGLFGRPWVGIRFDCCGVYSRVYRSTDGTAYRGRCPRCTRQVNLRVGAGGTRCRFFVAE